ncbi:MAG: phage portal protein [Pseudomonadota bacterium]|nr:phage portal protein [Pseudomonadota bacterium]
MLAGGGYVPYDAADIYSGHMAEWMPYLWSADGQLNMYRDRIVSRTRDMVRNDGWAAGGITRILDNAIGANFYPVIKPDYRALAAMTGNKAFDASWADAFGRVVEAAWRAWADDPGRYCNMERSQNVSQMMRLAFRHKLVDGDALAVLHWLPERVGAGRAKYATTVQLIDPDRLSNPQLQFDQMSFRGGVVIDAHGAATGYYIRRAHQGDWWSAAQSMTWDLIPRETPWGRPIVVHDFEHDRAGQHRGGAGILAPVLQRLKMLVKYDSTELDAAIVNAIFGAYIESPFDPAMVQDALGSEEYDPALGAYQAARADFHSQRKITLGEVRMPTLFPGEKINAVDATRPASNFRDFEGAVLRNAASGIGISAQQLSNDWSDVNYSSARAALLEAWKTLTRRRDEFAQGFCQQIFVAFLEEVMEVEELPLPGNAPDFIDARAAYSRCHWMGPGRGWIDPVKEKEGAILGIDAGLSTLEHEAAENTGRDWEEILDQRQREIQAFKDRGLPLPTWANIQPAGVPAQKTITEPEAT